MYVLTVGHESSRDICEQDVRIDHRKFEEKDFCIKRVTKLEHTLAKQMVAIILIEDEDSDKLIDVVKTKIRKLMHLSEVLVVASNRLDFNRDETVGIERYRWEASERYEREYLKKDIDTNKHIC